jgi:hypothetical protein
VRTSTLGIPAAILAGMAFCFAAPAHASSCGIDHQQAYERGVNDGRADGERGLKKKAKRHNPDLDRDSKRGQCYLEGYNIGYGNASADARKESSYDQESSHNGAPTPGSNERAYYDDGCRAGTQDAKLSMSMAYERHSDSYDRRFEPYFAQGYEACWKKHR